MTQIGSRLFGLERPDSDYDYVGIAMPSLQDALLDLAPDQEQNISPVSNGAEIIEFDTKNYSFRKYMKMLTAGNSMVPFEVLASTYNYSEIESSWWEQTQIEIEEHLDDLRTQKLTNKAITWLGAAIKATSDVPDEKLERCKKLCEHIREPETELLKDYSVFIDGDIPSDIEVTDTLTIQQFSELLDCISPSKPKRKMSNKEIFHATRNAVETLSFLQNPMYPMNWNLFILDVNTNMAPFVDMKSSLGSDIDMTKLSALQERLKNELASTSACLPLDCDRTLWNNITYDAMRRFYKI